MSAISITVLGLVLVQVCILVAHMGLRSSNGASVVLGACFGLCAGIALASLAMDIAGCPA
jgi:hypothetical protein